MFNIIQKMVHRSRVAFGDSNITNGGDGIVDWENTPQGVLQGNTAGPDIWSALSSVIFDVLHKRSFPYNMTSSISKQLFTLVGFLMLIIVTSSGPMKIL